MILKVVSAQPIRDHYKHDHQKPKDWLDKKKTASFASVLGTIIKSQSSGKLSS